MAQGVYYIDMPSGCDMVYDNRIQKAFKSNGWKIWQVLNYAKCLLYVWIDPNNIGSNFSILIFYQCIVIIKHNYIRIVSWAKQDEIIMVLDIRIPKDKGIKLANQLKD